MRAYLWTMLALLVLGVLFNALWLGLNHIPERTRGGAVVALLEGMALAAWTGYLLITEANHG